MVLNSHVCCTGELILCCVSLVELCRTGTSEPESYLLGIGALDLGGRKLGLPVYDYIMIVIIGWVFSV